MSAAAAHRPLIAPVEDGSTRPLWSVMIPTYNCAGYLRQTLESVLEQDPGPDAMQIEVVDDASTRDDPEAVVRELGGERVLFHRQPENVGFIRNFATCLHRSRGRLVHVLHGDDFVRPGFYEHLERAFDDSRKPEVGAAFCRHVYLDARNGSEALSLLERPEPGVLDDWLHQVAAGQRLATPSIVVRRDVYETLGGFDDRFTCAGEDWEMWVRIATRYPVWFEPEPLAVYRVKREGSLTDDASRTSRLVRDMLLAAQIIETYLPGVVGRRRARRLTRRARRTYAGWALEAAEQAVAARAPRAAVREPLALALRCAMTPGTLLASAGLYLRHLSSQPRRPAARRPAPREADGETP